MTSETPVMSVQMLRSQRDAIQGELEMLHQNTMRCHGAMALIDGLIRQAEQVVINANLAAQKEAAGAEVIVSDQAAS